MENVTQEITEFFQELEFDAKQHVYNVGNMRLPSVSKLIKEFCYPFDAQAISAKVAFNSGKTQKEILNEWDYTRIEACDRGHRVHDFGERYVWDRSLKPSCPQEEAIVKFWNELPDFIVPVVMELKMFHKYFNYAGTGDILLYNTKTRKFIIADYKTNKDLFKNYKNKKLKYPFAYLKDMPYSKYQLQLSFYQLLFEQTGYQVEKRRIIWLKKDSTYNMYDTQDFTHELKDYLTRRN